MYAQLKVKKNAGGVLPLKHGMGGRTTLVGKRAGRQKPEEWTQKRRKLLLSILRHLAGPVITISSAHAIARASTELIQSL